MDVRRIVTGYDVEGRGCVAYDGPAPRTHDFVHIPGFSNTLAWAAVDTAIPTGIPEDVAATTASLMPGPGGSGLTIVQFPPSSVMAAVDPAAAGPEQEEHLPGLADRFDPDRPGFHRTDTIDYAIVLRGELVLELETGEPTLVHTGDVVVQNGTWHAWHNPTSEPAVLAAVSIGTSSEAPPVAGP
ncbi:cupin domain-containing protein [Blastococcus sp. SYSU D00820]